MQNLTDLLKNEARWYSLLGLIRIRRGIPRRIPFYVVICWVVMLMLDEIPILPFYWLYELGDPLTGMVVGVAVNYIIVPMIVIGYLTLIEKKYKKSAKSHIQTMWNFRRSAKRVAGYRPIPEPAVYEFATPITYREVPRQYAKEVPEEKSQLAGVLEPQT
jgi:hypothetical protein